MTTYRPSTALVPVDLVRAGLAAAVVAMGVAAAFLGRLFRRWRTRGADQSRVAIAVTFFVAGLYTVIGVAYLLASLFQ